MKILEYKLEDLKGGYLLSELTKCRNCETNSITHRVNFINICDREDCLQSAIKNVYRLPCPPVEIVEI